MATSARNMARVKLPLAVKAHPTLITLALFALAFAGCFFVVNRPGSPAATLTAATPALGRVSLSGEAVALAGAGTPGADAREGASSDGEPLSDGELPFEGETRSDHDAGSLGASMAPRDAARAVPYVPAGRERAAERSARERRAALASATPPPLPEPGAAAADFAASLPSDPPPDDIAQTIDTLRNGASEDRVLAIQTLAATAHSGRALGRVRQSLRFAAADQDPSVAARAQEAYDSLMKRDDP